MFSKTAQYYDAIYHWKDYSGETRELHEFIQKHKMSAGNTLLDVACGTGGHIPYLVEKDYTVEGLDLDEGLLAVAKERSPQTNFYHGDMRTFDLNKQFDVIACLFSSIGYVKTLEAMRQTIANFAKHTKSGGVILVEPWFPPNFLNEHRISMQTIDEPELKIVRMNKVEIIGNLSILNFHYLIGTIDGIEHLTEKHEMGLFTHEEHIQAFTDAGLEVIHDEDGLMKRGLYIGKKA